MTASGLQSGDNPAVPPPSAETTLTSAVLLNDGIVTSTYSGEPRYQG
jgi:hypothetical protein